MVFFLDLIKSFQDIIMKKTSMIIARSLIFQTNSSGQSYKDSKTRLKEMILDEHTEVSGRVVMIEVAAMMESGLKMGRNGPFALSEVQSRQSVLARQRFVC